MLNQQLNALEIGQLLLATQVLSVELLLGFLLDTNFKYEQA